MRITTEQLKAVLGSNEILKGIDFQAPGQRVCRHHRTQRQRKKHPAALPVPGVGADPGRCLSGWEGAFLLPLSGICQTYLGGRPAQLLQL